MLLLLCSSLGCTWELTEANSCLGTVVALSSLLRLLWDSTCLGHEVSPSSNWNLSWDTAEDEAEGGPKCGAEEATDGMSIPGWQSKLLYAGWLANMLT